MLADLEAFTGSDAEQEDDITMVTLERAAGRRHAGRNRQRPRCSPSSSSRAPQGNEREAMARVEQAVGGLGSSPRALERLKTAVAEATMNAMEHGNEYRADRPGPDPRARSRRTACGCRSPTTAGRASSRRETPDLEAKLAGRQRPRGWGLFLIKKMVDEAHAYERRRDGHTLELSLRLEGGNDGDA